MDPNHELNQRLTSFCMQYLGRPTHRFSEQSSIPDECWRGAGFYLLRLERDEVDYLGADFDVAWKRVKVLKTELESSVRERERQLKMAERRRSFSDGMKAAQDGVDGARGLLGSLDGLVDDGLRRMRGLVDGAEMIREILRPEDEQR